MDRFRECNSSEKTGNQTDEGSTSSKRCGLLKPFSLDYINPINPRKSTGFGMGDKASILFGISLLS